MMKKNLNTDLSPEGTVDIRAGEVDKASVCLDCAADHPERPGKPSPGASRSGYEFVEVIWEDAVNVAGWSAMSQPAICITRGWLLKDENDHLVVAMTLQDDGSDFGGTWTIPWSMIKKVNKLD